MSRINLTDDADAIANKIRRAKTDPHPLPDSKDGLEGPAGSGKSAQHLCRPGRPGPRRGDRRVRRPAILRLQDRSLADLTVAKIGPMTAEMRRLLADPAEIDRILKSGAERARAIATPVMD